MSSKTAKPPIEELLTEEKREAKRQAFVDSIPGWYSPVLHLLVPSVFGIGMIVACIALLRDVQPLELLTVPAMLLAANAGEWRIHRDLLHKRSPIAPVLYDQHTPMHHVVYVTHDMALRSRREFRLVLIPFYGIMLIAVSIVPLTALIWYLGFRNPALLFLASAMFYTVSYEWLHLSYHLPPDSFIGRRRLIRVLRRHHAIHHHPRLMQRWNFNVSIPFWDLVRRTYAREAQLQDASVPDPWQLAPPTTEKQPAGAAE